MVQVSTPFCMASFLGAAVAHVDMRAAENLLSGKRAHGQQWCVYPAGGALPSRAHLLLSPTKLRVALVLDGRAVSVFGTQTFAISGISQVNLLGGSS